MLLKVDDNEFYLTFDKGALTDIQPGPSRKTPWRFALYTDAGALEQFWQPGPRPAFTTCSVWSRSAAAGSRATF